MYFRARTIFKKPPGYIFSASGHNDISKKPSPLVQYCMSHPPSNSPPGQLVISWERVFLINLVKKEFKNIQK
jgi:hypothetical protein